MWMENITATGTRKWAGPWLYCPSWIVVPAPAFVDSANVQIWSPTPTNSLFLLSVLHDLLRIYQDSTLTVADDSQRPSWNTLFLLAGFAVSHGWGGSRDVPPVASGKKRESFQDGGIDLPVRWKTIETAHWAELARSYSGIRSPL